VVYESMFGNTELIARAITEGLAKVMDVELVEVGAAPPEVDEDITLLVVGGPTHAFGMSRASTRQVAASEAPRVVSTRIGIREWLFDAAPEPGRLAAAFDTKSMGHAMPGSAARRARRQLQRLGYRCVVVPESFLVDGTKGPLRDGELGRAERWGASVAAATLDALTSSSG